MIRLVSWPGNAIRLLRRLYPAAALALIAALVFSRAVFCAPDPETQVEISIFDLVGKVPPKARAKRRAPAPKLPADYGRRIAALLEASRPRLTDCLSGIAASPLTLPTQLEIAPDGHAAVSLDGEESSREPSRACLTRILSSISYPKHPLPGPVTVKFPLVLQRREL